MKTSFDEYLRYEDLTRVLHDLAGKHRGQMRIESVGRSGEGREIWLVELTNEGTGPASEKPAFWVDGNTHAGEVTGSMAALYLIELLLERYGHDDLVTRLLDEQAFYVLPRISPDGAERYLTTPHTLRSNPRPWPEPEPEPGLQPEDVDGDGHILQMRVKDEGGEWRTSDGDERLLVPRGPDEVGGKYYRLYKEGVFRDYDGFERKIAQPFHGLDMNRQYPYRWREDADQRGAGPYPLSEPESRAHVDALLARKNVFSIHTHHTFCGAILRPYSDRDDKEMPDPDLAVYKAIGDRGTEITGYPNISVYHDFRYEEDKFITGAFDDWAYDYYGVFAFTIEFWSLPAAAGVEVKDFIPFFRDPPEEASLAMLAWNDKELDGEGFSPWKPVEHPQLGPVELLVGQTRPGRVPQSLDVLGNPRLRQARGDDEAFYAAVGQYLPYRAGQIILPHPVDRGLVLGDVLGEAGDDLSPGVVALLAVAAPDGDVLRPLVFGDVAGGAPDAPEDGLFRARH